MQYFGLAFEFFGILFVCAGGGLAIDKYLLGGGFVAFLIGMAVGFFYGIYHLQRRGKQIFETIKNTPKKETDASRTDRLSNDWKKTEDKLKKL